VNGELDLGYAHTLATAKTRLEGRTRDCVTAIGGPEVAVAVTKARAQDLGDALAGRPGRRLPPEWIWRIAIISPEELRAEVANALVNPLGYGISPIKPLTTEEKLARLEYRVAARFGQAGSELVEENRR
jgi:hypothetical protein